MTDNPDDARWGERTRAVHAGEAVDPGTRASSPNIVMMTFQTREDGRKVAEQMIDRLRVIHYAVSLGHHRLLIYWIPAEMLMQSTFRLAPAAEAGYRDFAGAGVFRFSAGIEDAGDLCADLAGVLS